MTHYYSVGATIRNGYSTVSADIVNGTTFYHNEEHGQYQCLIQGLFDVLPSVPEESFPLQQISLAYIGNNQSEVNKVKALTFSNLSIRSLLLQDFKLEEIEEGGFATNNSLTDLYLHNLGLTEINASFFHLANDLTLLSIKGNSIKVLKDFTFSNLTNLRRLYLDEPLEEIQPRFFGGFHLLDYFEYHELDLEKECAGLITSLYRGIVIIVYNQQRFINKELRTALKDIPFVKAGYARNLHALAINQGRTNWQVTIRLTDDNHLGGWENFIGNLAYVYLSDIIIKEIYPCTFKGFTVLKELWLNKTSTSVIREGAFDDLISLTNLMLNYLPLKVISLQVIGPIADTLEKIDLEGTALGCECENFWLHVSRIIITIVWIESPEFGCRDEENEFISIYEYGMQYCSLDQLIDGIYESDDTSNCSQNSDEVEDHRTEVISKDVTKTEVLKTNSFPTSKDQISLLIAAIYLAYHLQNY